MRDAEPAQKTYKPMRDTSRCQEPTYLRYTTDADKASIRQYRPVRCKFALSLQKRDGGW